MWNIFNNILGFIGYCFKEKMVLLSLIGYILILISPAFSWYSSALSYPGVNEKNNYNMFQLSADPVKEKCFTVFGILTIVLAIAFIIIEYKDYRVKLRRRLAVTIVIEMIFYIALAVIVAMSLKNPGLEDIMSYRGGEIRVLEYWIKEAEGYCNNGIGPAIYISGLGLAILSKVWVYIYSFVDAIKDSMTGNK